MLSAGDVCGQQEEWLFKAALELRKAELWLRKCEENTVKPVSVNRLPKAQKRHWKTQLKFRRLADRYMKRD